MIETSVMKALKTGYIMDIFPGISQAFPLFFSTRSLGVFRTC